MITIKGPTECLIEGMAGYSVVLSGIVLAAFFSYKDAPLADILRDAAAAIDTTMKAKAMALAAISQAMKEKT